MRSPSAFRQEDKGSGQSSGTSVSSIGATAPGLDVRGPRPAAASTRAAPRRPSDGMLPPCSPVLRSRSWMSPLVRRHDLRTRASRAGERPHRPALLLPHVPRAADLPEDKERLNGFMASRTSGPLGWLARFGLIARRRTTARRSAASAPTASSRARPAPSSAPSAAPPRTSRTSATCSRRSSSTPRRSPRHLLAPRRLHAHTFVRRFGGLKRGETMPAIVSAGYIGDDGSERIREREEGSRRLPPAASSSRTSGACR